MGSFTVMYNYAALQSDGVLGPSHSVVFESSVSYFMASTNE